MIQKIVVTGFVVHEGKTLIVRRALTERFLPGYWELPGGKVDPGEDPEAALHREFMEEVNLRIGVIRPFRVFSYVDADRNTHAVEILYLVRLADDPANLRLGDDHMDVAWVTPREAEKYLVSVEMLECIRAGFREAE